MPISPFKPGKDRMLPLAGILPPDATQVRDISTDWWFGPLQPIAPVAPASYRIRQYQYTPGANIIWEPRGDSAIDFETLRTLADNYDLLRIVIETRKDQICSRAWEVRAIPEPQETLRDRKERELRDPNIQALNAFFNSPDGFRPWRNWLRLWLEDYLVIDAVALYLERDTKDRIARVLPVDGTTINRILTDQGVTPPPPSVAYQQVIFGLPVMNLTTDDMLYSMRNERTWKRYGYSRCEQILLSINTGLRREEFQLQYYSSGTVPEGLVFMPPGMPPDKIKEAQDWFDSVLSGDLARRRRITFLPSFGDSGSSKPNIVFPKEPLLKDEMDEWLARIICYAFGISPQGFIKMMNRASAAEATDTNVEEGLEPDLVYVSEVMNQIIAAMGLADKYEFAWKERRDVDVLKQAQADSIIVGKVVTVNEIREARGMDPRPEPQANMLGVFTPALGFIPIGEDGLQQQQQQGNTPKPQSTKPGSPKQIENEAERDAQRNKPKKPAKSVRSDMETPVHDEDDDPSGAKKPKKPAAETGGRMGIGGKEETGWTWPQTADLPGDFGQHDHPAVHDGANTLGGTHKAVDPQPATHSLGDVQYVTPAGADNPKDLAIHPKRRSKKLNRAQKGLEKTVSRWLARQQDVLKEGLESEGLLHKAVGNNRKTKEELAAYLYGLLEWERLAEASEPWLEHAAQEGVDQGIDDVGMPYSEIPDVENSAAIYATQRSAALAGGKWEDGFLIPDDSAEKSLASRTRKAIDDVAETSYNEGLTHAQFLDALEGTGAFSAERARFVAENEISMSHAYAQLGVWRDSGKIKKVRWVVSAQHPRQDECDANAIAGEIPVGQRFPTGDFAPPAHPECLCSLRGIS